MQDMSTSQPSPLAGSTVDDLLLVTATVQAEATGSNTPLIKEELRYTIQKNRRRRGQPDVVPKYNDPGPESLTPRDIRRMENRRASNRRAADKCRKKKKALEALKQEEMAKLVAENEQLRTSVQELTTEKRRLADMLKNNNLACENEHLKKSVADLTDMLTKNQCIGCALGDFLRTTNGQHLLNDTAVLPPDQ